MPALVVIGVGVAVEEVPPVSKVYHDKVEPEGAVALKAVEVSFLQ